MAPTKMTNPLLLSLLVAKDRLRKRYKGKPWLKAIGVGGDSKSGYTIELRVSPGTSVKFPKTCNNFNVVVVYMEGYKVR